MKNGIDVSKHQGTIDWQKVKDAGVQFAILRAGYGSLPAQKDVQFERNYSECKRLGIPVGAYLYSYAVSTADARAEAANLLAFCAGKQMEYPLWFDQEYEKRILSLTNAQRTDIVQTFCSAVQDAGWYCGLYASTDFIKNKLDYSRLAAFDIWSAQYGAVCTCPLPFGMWQYTSSGSVNGISGAVDRNWAYKDYPTIMQEHGLNGFAAAGAGAAPTTEPAAESEAPAAGLRTLQVGPMSAGDYDTVQQLASSLGLPCSEVDSNKQAQLEAITVQCNAAVAGAAAATTRADTYLRAINAARAALEV